MNDSKIIFGHDNISLKRVDLFGLIFRKFVKINYSDIKNVVVVDSVFKDGKVPFSGTGSFWNYFPSGLKKRNNEKIFIIERTSGKWKIGFSSGLWLNVIHVFKANGIIIELEN